MIKIIALRILPALRSSLYKHGFRPKRGSIFYSPSLEAMYILKKFLKQRK